MMTRSVYTFRVRSWSQLVRVFVEHRSWSSSSFNGAVRSWSIGSPPNLKDRTNIAGDVPTPSL